MAVLALLRPVTAVRYSVPVFLSIRADLQRLLGGAPGHRRAATESDTDTQIDVPLEKLQVSFSRSSGPGGQHVNKVSSRAEVRFHVQTADWLPTAVRREILSVHQSRITKAGYLCVRSEVSRCQHRNLQECVRKISELIKEANQKLTDSINREKSENVEDEQKQFRLKRWNEQRLRQKKIASAIKKSRRMDYD